jgi:heterodisulfide reductase subunit C
MRRAVLGLENEALTDPDLWLCTTCYSCTDRCPRDIAPTDVIMAMRNLAAKRDIVPVNFLKTVQAIYSSGHGVPNNDVNRAARERLGMTRDPATTHMYPEYMKGIQKILDHYGLKARADRIVKEREG